MQKNMLKDCDWDTESYDSCSVARQPPSAGQKEAETENMENQNQSQ